MREGERGKGKGIMHEVGMTSRRLAGGTEEGPAVTSPPFLCMLQKANGFCFREGRGKKGDVAHTLPRVVSLSLCGVILRRPQSPASLSPSVSVLQSNTLIDAAKVPWEGSWRAEITRGTTTI